MPDPVKRIEKRAAKKKAKVLIDEANAARKAARKKGREEKKNIEAVNKNVRAKMEGYDSTKDKKDARAKRAQETISRARSKEKNVNVTGDRRVSGNNTTVSNTDNSVKNKSTSTSSRSDQGQTNKPIQANQQATQVRSAGGSSRSSAQGGKAEGGNVDQSRGNNRNNRTRTDNSSRNSNNNNRRSLLSQKKGGTPEAKYGKAMKPSMLMSNNDLMQYKKGKVKK